MALSKEVREAVVAKLADEALGLNARFVAHCRDYSVPVLAPGMGGTPDQPFDFSPGSMTFFQTDIDISQLEKVSELQYPCVMLSTQSARMSAQNKITPSMFWGQILVDLRVYLAWAVNEPPPGNNYEIYLDIVQRCIIEIFNRGFQTIGGTGAYWGDGIVYGGDISEISRDRMTATNENRLWRRGSRFQLTVMVFEQ